MKFVEKTRFLVTGGGVVVLLTYGSSLLLADQFPDDYADDVVGASVLPLHQTRIGNVEIDTDQDVFQISGQFGNQYTITVTPTTLKDATVRVRSSDGSYTVVAAHSVGATEAILVYPHAAGSTPLFIEVCGFAKFTTGSYSIHVSEQPIIDSDSDGMADAWETLFFTNLTSVANGDEDADGMSNFEEYVYGYNPMDPTSLFMVTGADVMSPPFTISWASAPFRSYEIQAVESMSDTNWQTVGTVSGNSPFSMFSDHGSLSWSQRYWRIRIMP